MLKPIFNPYILQVGFMNIEDKTEGNPENRAYILELGRRVASIESSIQNLAGSIRHGVLAPEQEQRVAAVEERLENVEDLQMVANLDLIKIKDAAERIQHGAPGALAPVGDDSFRRKVEEIEGIMANMSRAMNEIKASKNQGNAPADAALRNEIRGMRDDFASFRRETEESIRIIVESIKKIIENMRQV
jgi:hypothetical protein